MVGGQRARVDVENTPLRAFRRAQLAQFVRLLADVREELQRSRLLVLGEVPQREIDRFDETCARSVELSRVAVCTHRLKLRAQSIECVGRVWVGARRR